MFLLTRIKFLKSITFLGFSMLCNTVSAQYLSTSGGTVTGNVSVLQGRITTNEIAITDPNGGDDSDPYRFRKVNSGSNNNWLELQLNDDADESFRIYGNSCAGSGCGQYSGNMYHKFDASGNVYHAGNVGIGTTNTGSYKLAVEGMVGVRKIVVTQAPNWADYVFHPKYNLMSLTDLAAYIKVNQHLPEIPSAKTVAKDGLDLAEMQKLMMQKIEELTLYIIEQDKQIKQLKKTVTKLQSNRK